MNVLSDTHAALVTGGLLLDFHPVAPPWPRVVARGEELGELREENFLDDLRAVEAGMHETIDAGLFEPVAARTHEIAEHYAEPDELLDAWTNDEGEWISPALERRLRSTTGPIDVIERLVFHLYRAVARGA